VNPVTLIANANMQHTDGNSWFSAAAVSSRAACGHSLQLTSDTARTHALLLYRMLTNRTHSPVLTARYYVDASCNGGTGVFPAGAPTVTQSIVVM
jgi:hypothetical protein